MDAKHQDLINIMFKIGIKLSQMTDEFSEEDLLKWIEEEYFQDLDYHYYIFACKNGIVDEDCWDIHHQTLVEMIYDQAEFFNHAKSHAVYDLIRTHLWINGFYGEPDSGYFYRTTTKIISFVPIQAIISKSTIYSEIARPSHASAAQTFGIPKAPEAISIPEISSKDLALLNIAKKLGFIGKYDILDLQQWLVNAYGIHVSTDSHYAYDYSSDSTKRWRLQVYDSRGDQYLASIPFSSSKTALRSGIVISLRRIRIEKMEKAPTDLDRFLAFYRHIGFTPKVEYEQDNGNVVYWIKPPFYCSPSWREESEFDGYSGFYTDFEFTPDGRFIRQGVWE